MIAASELLRLYRHAEQEAVAALDVRTPLSAADLRWPAIHLYALLRVQNAILREKGA